jgi:hypothetical protein
MIDRFGGRRFDDGHIRLPLRSAGRLSEQRGTPAMPRQIVSRLGTRLTFDVTSLQHKGCPADAVPLFEMRKRHFATVQHRPAQTRASEGSTIADVVSWISACRDSTRSAS